MNECLDSLLQQTYKNFEIIAVNDGSTDGSVKILEDFAQKDTRIKIITQSNKGLSAARNTGMEHASGNYLIFADSDDYVAPNLVATCLATFEQSKADLVLFNHAIFSNDIVFEPQLKKLNTGLYDGLSFLQQISELPTYTWNPVWLYAYKSTFLKNNGLRFYEGLFHEDILFTPMALTYAKTVTTLPDVLYYYRQRPESITTSTKNAEKSLNDYFFIAEELYKFGEHIDHQEKKSAFFNLLSKRYQFLVEACLKSDASYSKLVYKKVVSSLRGKKDISKLFNIDFYRLHIETKSQKRLRNLKEQLFKWPRRIYKYKIKPHL